MQQQTVWSEWQSNSTRSELRPLISAAADSQHEVFVYSFDKQLIIYFNTGPVSSIF